MKIQVMISTMHQKSYDLIHKMNIQTDAVVINQCEKAEEVRFKNKNYNIEWVHSLKRGLSKSRNDAITKAEGDICLLADDDLVYINGYEQIIIEQFKKYPEADVITFQVEGIESKFKEYNPKSQTLNYISSMKVSSVEIAFRLKSIKENNIKFDELFGSGAKYYMGEESIFLFDCLKGKLRIVYVPIKIADLHIGNSTWFKGYNQDYFISKGAAFTRMSKNASIFLILQFAIRKAKLFNKKIGVFQAIQLMIKGRSDYLKSLKL